jgi:hypothetical protein
VLLDVVYNHAGGDFGDQSLFFFDRQSTAGGNSNSLYFTDKGHAGGLVFGLCRKFAFLRQNLKIVFRKINDLCASTFLFSVICDRAMIAA